MAIDFSPLFHHSLSVMDMTRLFVSRRPPSIIVGISGTDSTLAALLCARAIENADLDCRLHLVHFGPPFPPEGRSEDDVRRILGTSPSYRWVPRVLMPWLAEKLPSALVETRAPPPPGDDHARWAELFRISIEDGGWVAFEVRLGLPDKAGLQGALGIVSSFDRDDPTWLAEAYMLLNTPTLRREDWRYMGSTLFRDGSWSKEIRLATYMAARFGTIGFSFPKWRFLTQSFGGGTSLCERFGMTRLRRDTDVRDPSAPDPSRDLFGAGFAILEGATYMEARRTYVVLSQKMGRAPATVVIRNSSFFFGRDRLDHPAYVCWEPLFAAELEALSPADFAPDGRFVPWHLAFPRKNVSDPSESLFAVADLLQKFYRLECDLERWLRRDGPPLRRDYRTGPDGRRHLLAFLESRESGRAGPFLAEIEADTPPWFPMRCADPRHDDIRPLIRPPEGFSNSRLVLLSGPNGDLPLATGSAGKQIPAT